MRSETAIESQIKQMEELQQRRLEELANNDPIYQKAQGALEAFRLALVDEGETQES
tara:strand:- start:806 stop:973 length:168 start_codon:yes stop_codon:yes gene_type:complete